MNSATGPLSQLRIGHKNHILDHISKLYMHRKCSGVDPGRADMHVGVGGEGGRCTGLLRCQVDRGENRTLTLLAVVDRLEP